MPALRRQLPFLRQIAARHRLLVVFFEDEDLVEWAAQNGKATGKEGIEGYYQRVEAQKFVYDQRLIAQTLRQYGIQSLLTTPRQLSVDVINKYLAIRVLGV
jgi:hypothetical protein